MFTARCVPNMYLFGTFSAQNPPKIAPSPTVFPQPGRDASAHAEGSPTLLAGTRRRWSGGGIRPPGSQRRH